jgi:cell division protein FtsB
MKNVIKKVIIIAFVIYASVTLVGQQITLRRMEAKKADLTKQVEQAKKETDNYKKTLKSVSTDTYAEKIARDKLGLVKDGDIIYVDTGRFADPLKGAENSGH